MYIHIHWHSHYSLLESIGKVGKIIDKAKEYGYPAIGITDYNGMYGIMEFYTKAKKADIKPLCGIELTLNFQLAKKPDQEQFIVLIAKDYEGYKNLMKLTTIASTKGSHIIPITDFATLEQHAQGVICVLWGARSILNAWLKIGYDKAKLAEQLQWFQKVFAGDFYLELTAQEYALEPELKTLNNQIMSWWQEYGIPIIASTNFHYIAAKDKQAFEVALAIKDQRQITDPLRRTIKGNYYIMKPDEVEAVLLKNGYTPAQIQERFASNQKLVDTVDLQLPAPTAKFPTYQSPEEMISLYDKMKNNLIQEK